MTDRVLVTGATGFIAQHCMLQLLDAGYDVRGTARSADRTRRGRRDLVARTSATPARDAARSACDVVAADLTSDDGWRDAVEGCRFVMHVASPLPRGAAKDENELIVPARDGTLARPARRARRRRRARRAHVVTQRHRLRQRPIAALHRSRLVEPRRGPHRRLRQVQDHRRARRLGLHGVREGRVVDGARRRQSRARARSVALERLGHVR